MTHLHTPARTVLTTLTTAGLTTLATIVLLASPATARVTRQVSSFTPAEIEDPQGISVEQATGDVFVAGEESHNVEKFTPSGVHITSFVSPIFEEEPESIAVDNSSDASKGDIYVTGLAMGEVVKLDPDGTAAPGFTPITASSIPAGDPGSEGVRFVGVAVDPENGDVVVTDRENSEVDIFSSVGVFISQFAGPHGAVAVGSDDDIFTADESGALQWLPPLYESSRPIDAGESAYGIAVDQATGRMFVEAPRKPREITEYEEVPGTPPTWTAMLHFGQGLIEYSGGVAVDEATNTVYAASPGNGTVEVFGSPVSPPVVLTGAASGVTATAAQLNGEVDPDGVPVTTCRFEYGLTSAYGQSALCSPPPPLTGTATIPVIARLAVHPDRTYHYRLVAINEQGISENGQDETFQTQAPEPAVSESASAITQTTATIDASIDPNDQPTGYRFEYGTTSAYGTIVPAGEASAGAGYEAVHVSQELAGLQPDTTYHYRVVATNGSSSAGGTIGPDQTFTTPPLEPPMVSTGQAVNVAQNTVTLTGTIGTQGYQTEYEFDFGTDTSYGTRIFGDAGSEAGAHTFSVTLQGLQPGTTYHFRIAATNTFGTTYGEDVTFTTGIYPSALLSEPVAPPLLPAILLAPEPTSAKGATAKTVNVRSTAHAARRKAAGDRPDGHEHRRKRHARRVGETRGVYRGRDGR